MNTNKFTFTIPSMLHYLLAFLLLEFICMQAHEITHHLVGRIVCGDWGNMTFNIFTLAEGCFETKKIALLSTLAGPALSYFLMWAGMIFVLRSKYILFGFSLIFANLPFARFVSVVLGGGDETVIARGLIETNTYLVLLFVVVFIILPPLIVAYKAIANNYHWLFFVSFLLLPLAFDALLKRVLLAPLVTRWGLLAIPVFGIPFFIISFDLVMLAAFLWFAQYLFREAKPKSVFIGGKQQYSASL